MDVAFVATLNSSGKVVVTVIAGSHYLQTTQIHPSPIRHTPTAVPTSHTTLLSPRSGSA